MNPTGDRVEAANGSGRTGRFSTASMGSEILAGLTTAAVVVPKALRDELGLTGGQELEIAVRDGRLELEPPPVAMHLERRGQVWPREVRRFVEELVRHEARETTLLNGALDLGGSIHPE